MRKLIPVLGLVILWLPLHAQIESDTEKTARGDLEMYFIGHGTLMFKFDGKVIHIDPVSREADYTKLPDADLVLVTHEHGDHLDMSAIDEIRKADTRLVMTQACVENLEGMNARVLNNGDQAIIDDIVIEALPAYNIVHKRDGGQPFHPKGRGNAYLLELGGKRVLIGGDTENVPELKTLEHIDIAFLPMNLPYTMSPEMVADLAKAIRPAVLYPYHFGQTDTGKLVALLKEEKDIEVRIRKLQ